MPSIKGSISEFVDVFLWLRLLLRLSHQSLTLLVGSVRVYLSLSSSLDLYTS